MWDWKSTKYEKELYEFCPELLVSNLMRCGSIPTFRRTLLQPEDGGSMILRNIGILTISVHGVTTQKTST